MALSDWSTTAASNVLANIGISFDEGWLPSTVNDSMRSLIAQMATAFGNYPGQTWRNKLINGDMEVWQRGTSIAVAASATAYAADRWYITTGANQASVIARQTGLTNGSRYCARVQRNSGQTGTGAIVFGQPIPTDILVALRGIKATISASLRSGANWSPTSGNITMSLFVGTGAEAKRGGGFTGETTAAAVTTALGTTSAITLVSATSAAIIPTNAAQGELQFTWTPTGTAGTNDYVEIDEVQIELGSVASPFERVLFAEALMRCQRFYWKTFPYATTPAQSGGVTGAISTKVPIALGDPSVYVQFPTRMRTTPTVTTYNPSAGNANWRDITAAADVTVSVDPGTTLGDSGVLIATSAVVATLADILAIHLAADAEI